MTDIIWLLILTVCRADGMCVSQEVEEFNNYNVCTQTRFEYEASPKDGDWKTIVYTCKLKNGTQT
jgi:hypothetical protein